MLALFLIQIHLTHPLNQSLGVREVADIRLPIRSEAAIYSCRNDHS
jgi:hypothetical protein